MKFNFGKEKGDKTILKVGGFIASFALILAVASMLLSIFAPSLMQMAYPWVVLTALIAVPTLQYGRNKFKFKHSLDLFIQIGIVAGLSFIYTMGFLTAIPGSLSTMIYSGFQPFLLGLIVGGLISVGVGFIRLLE